MRTTIVFLFTMMLFSHTWAQSDKYQSDKYVVAKSTTIYQVAYHQKMDLGVLWAWNLPLIDIKQVESIYKYDRYRYVFAAGDTLTIPQGDSSDVYPWSDSKWGWEIAWPWTNVITCFDPNDWIVSFYKPFGRVTRGDSLQVQISYGHNQKATIVEVRIYETPRFQTTTIYILNGKVFWARRSQPSKRTNMFTFPAERDVWEMSEVDLRLTSFTLKEAGLVHLPEYIQREIEKAGLTP